MPIYEYKCLDCKENFEILAKLGKNSFDCPKCSSKNIQKVISIISGSYPANCHVKCKPNCKCG